MDLVMNKIHQYCDCMLHNQREWTSLHLCLHHSRKAVELNHRNSHMLDYNSIYWNYVDV